MTNLSRHPVLRAIYGASQAIEKCGASRELTDAVMAVTALYAPAEGLLDHIASLERQLEEARAQLAERTRERDEARTYCAGLASYICEPIYDDVANRAGVQADAEAVAGGAAVERWANADKQRVRAESVERQMEKMREALRKLLDHINVYFDDPNCDICANARAALAPAQQEKGEQT